MEKDITIMRDGLKLAAKVSIPESKEYDIVILAYGFVGMMDPYLLRNLPKLSLINLCKRATSSTCSGAAFLLPCSCQMMKVSATTLMAW
ncbi:hypothetical protein VSS59_06580 [Lactobacillus delbrueckii subsp. allosunkii]